MLCERFGNGFNGGYGGYMMGSGWGIFFMIIIVLILIAAVYLIARTLSHRNIPAGFDKAPSNKALEILDERFARGEINEEEYKARKEQLLK